MPRQSNILFILTDQQAACTVGAGDNPHVRTPHLDALAAGGVRFAKSYCTSPVCGPSRTSHVTSLMPHRHGVETNALLIREGTATMGEVFRAAGYETAWAGKKHVPHARTDERDELPGFDNLPVPAEGHWFLGAGGDGARTDQAIAFVRRPHDRPFLLTLSLQNPHDICYWIMERHRDVIGMAPPADGLPPLPENFAVMAGEPEFLAECRRRDHYGEEPLWTVKWTEDEWRRYLWVYYRMVEHADANIGRLLGALREAGLADDTLVVFTSDHGECMAAHQLVVKLMPYEEAVRVPLILRWPGRVPAGRVDDAHLVSGLDLLPTVCDYAGVAAREGWEGVSLKPWIEDPSLPGRAFVVSELQPDTERPEMKARILRSARYKYVAFSHGGRRELLFDLQDDPGEMTDLAAEPARAEELARHRALLAAWCRETADDFRVPQ